MRVIAHRGFAGEAPENTVPAVRRAARLADGVEVDVRRCASGEPVLLHDATLDRVTGADARVADLTLAELRDLDVLGSGACVPSLAEAVAAIPPDTELIVELKEPGLVPQVVDDLADHEGPATLASFSLEALREARAVAPSVPRALITGRLRDRPVTTALELDCSALLLAWRLAFVPRVADTAADLDLPVYAWTVRSRAVARALGPRPIEGVIVDDRSVLGQASAAAGGRSIGASVDAER